MKDEDKKDEVDDEDPDQIKPVNIKDEVNQLLTNFNFLNESSLKALEHLNKAFTNKNKQLIILMNKILDSEVKITEMKQIPYICDSEGKDIIILAMFIQNCQQSKNSDRVKAVEAKQYIEILDSQQASSFLSELLKEKLIQKLLGKESDLMK